MYIEVKGQGHTEVMNVQDTSYHGDTLTCQTKYNYVKGQQEMFQKQTDRPTDRQLQNNMPPFSRGA